MSIFDQRSLDDYMSGYDTTSDVESGVVRYLSGLDLWSVHKMSIVCWEKHMDVQQVRRGLRRQGASQRSLEEYMSGYDTQVPFHLQNVQKQSF